MLDVATLLVSAALAFFVGFAGTLVTWLVHRHEVPALRWWLASSIAMPIGIALVVLRGRVPDVVSIDVANGALFLGMGLAVRGHAAWAGRGPVIWTSTVVPAVATSALAFFHLVVPHIGARGVVHGVAIAVTNGAIARLLLVTAVGSERLPSLLGAGVGVFAAATGAARAIGALSLGRSASLFAIHRSLVVLALASIACVILIQLMRLLLVGARLLHEERALVRELASANANVRTLQGLLPQCAWCHRIREEDGSWASLAEFVERHTNAAVSHGLCPTCEEREFGVD